MVRCYLLATNSLFDRYWIATLDLASKGPRVPPLEVQGGVALPPEDPSAPDLPLNAGDDLAGIRLVWFRAPVAKPSSTIMVPPEILRLDLLPRGQISAVFRLRDGVRARPAGLEPKHARLRSGFGARQRCLWRI